MNRYPFDTNVPELMDMLVAGYEAEEYRIEQFLKGNKDDREQRNKEDNKN